MSSPKIAILWCTTESHLRYRSSRVEALRLANLLVVVSAYTHIGSKLQSLGVKAAADVAEWGYLAAINLTDLNIGL